MYTNLILEKLEGLSRKLNLIRFFCPKSTQSIILLFFVVNVLSFFGVLFCIFKMDLVLILISIALFSVLTAHTLWLIKLAYSDVLAIKNRKKTSLTKEEKEMVSDAVSLIKKVDSKIKISDFNIFKLNLGSTFFSYRGPGKLDIYVSFPLMSLFTKNVCFKAVLHEILHSQNLRKDNSIFTLEFLEGLNEYLTIWLIHNYSTKYTAKEHYKENPNYNFYAFYFNGTAYLEEVKTVHKVLENAGVDIKEVFLNYVEFNPDYFKKFVPEKYIKK